jgi:hypothetical protein
VETSRPPNFAGGRLAAETELARPVRPGCYSAAYAAGKLRGTLDTSGPSRSPLPPDARVASSSPPVSPPDPPRSPRVLPRSPGRGPDRAQDGRSRDCSAAENVFISTHIFLDPDECGQLSRSLAYGGRQPARRFGAKASNSQGESNEIRRVCDRLAIAGHSHLTPRQVPTRGKICRYP